MSAEQEPDLFESLRAGQIELPANPTDGLPLSYTARSWTRLQAPDLAAWQRYIAFHKNLGFNNISFDVAWREVEAQRGKYDFSTYDPYIQCIADEGLTLQLKLNTRGLPDYITGMPGRFLCGPDGKEVNGANVFHTLADAELNRSMQALYRAVAERYRGLPNLFYSSAFAVSFESEYHHSIWTDYSLPARRQMAKFLQDEYGTLDRLNSRYGRSFSNWDEAALSWQPPETLKDGRPDAAFIDFVKYREESARQWLDTVLAGLRESDPQAQYGPQVGRIAGPMAPKRGTPGVFYWAENADWIFVDPGPCDDMNWEVAVARAGGKRVAVELDGPYMFRRLGLDGQMDKLYLQHTRLCYESGAEYLTIANWGTDLEYLEHLDLFTQLAEVKRKKYAAPEADETVYLSKWDMYLFGDAEGYGYQKSRERFQSLQAEGKTLDVILDDPIMQAPSLLNRYRKIHMCGTKVVSRAVWDAISASGAEIVFGQGNLELMDEYGEERWKGER